jgi:cephalosporin-C deacetylase
MRHNVKPELSRPPDFQEFWEDTLAALNAVPADVAAVEEAHDHDPKLRLRRLGFSSLGSPGEGRISGYLLTGPGDRPLVVHSHGYGSEYEIRWDWAQQGVNVLGVDIRGFGRSAAAVDDVSNAGYVLTGIHSPETSILRSAVCDYARAVQVGRELLGPSTTRLVLHGVSFAGGLALMAEALLQVADVLVLGVPTFGWTEGRHFFVKLGSGAEISAYLAAHPQAAEDVSLVLKYFDSMSFAPDIRCSTLVGLGLADDVVPAKTVYAIANHLGGPHELMEFPVSHTDQPEEVLWNSFDARCIDLALNGPPPNFGGVADTE